MIYSSTHVFVLLLCSDVASICCLSDFGSERLPLLCPPNYAAWRQPTLSFFQSMTVLRQSLCQLSNQSPFLADRLLD